MTSFNDYDAHAAQKRGMFRWNTVPLLTDDEYAEFYSWLTEVRSYIDEKYAAVAETRLLACGLGVRWEGLGRGEPGLLVLPRNGVSLPFYITTSVPCSEGVLVLINYTPYDCVEFRDEIACIQESIDEYFSSTLYRLSLRDGKTRYTAYYPSAEKGVERVVEFPDYFATPEVGR